MNTKRLLLICFGALALAIATGGAAYAGNDPDLCDGQECGPQPPPPPPPPPPAPPPPPPETPSYLPMGRLDTVSAEGVAYGWACDPNDFGVPLDIHFYVDGPAGVGGTFIGSTTANIGREPGVAAACGGNAYHGFAFRLPDSVRNNVARALYAYAINIGPAASNPLLAGSPLWFTLASPADLNVALWSEAFHSTSSDLYYAGGVRCKRYAFTQHYTQAGLYRVMRYEGAFALCYRYLGGIVSVSYRTGDSYWSCCGWEWRGNESGYPYHRREARKVTFYYRGKMAFCIISIGCGPERHPWMNFTFHDNNTITREYGIA